MAEAAQSTQQGRGRGLSQPAAGLGPGFCSPLACAVRGVLPRNGSDSHTHKRLLPGLPGLGLFVKSPQGTGNTVALGHRKPPTGQSLAPTAKAGVLSGTFSVTSDATLRGHVEDGLLSPQTTLDAQRH